MHRTLSLLLLAAAQFGACTHAAPLSLSVSVAPATLDQENRAAVVNSIAAAAEQRYVYEAEGREIAAKLRQQLASGAYDRFADPESFAGQLTADMRAVVPDVHLRAVYEPNRSSETIRPVMIATAAPSSQPAGGTYIRIDPRSVEQLAASNYGFEKVERLPENVGYLKLSKMVPLALAEAAATKAMTQLKGADAVIIDLRGVPGGSPDMVVQLVSYFTGPRSVPLMTSYDRFENSFEKLSTLAVVPGAKLAGVPLYVLQDKSTASAGEMFSYFVKQLKLGTIVGETSAGAGNGGNMIPVGSKISFFIPERRVVDGPGWERTGIKPDVASSSADAFDIAYAKARAKIRH